MRCDGMDARMDVQTARESCGGGVGVLRCGVCMCDVLRGRGGAERGDLFNRVASGRFGIWFYVLSMSAAATEPLKTALSPISDPLLNLPFYNLLPFSSRLPLKKILLYLTIYGPKNTPTLI